MELFCDGFSGTLELRIQGALIPRSGVYLVSAPAPGVYLKGAYNRGNTVFVMDKNVRFI